MIYAIHEKDLTYYGEASTRLFHNQENAVNYMDNTISNDYSGETIEWSDDRSVAYLPGFDFVFILEEIPEFDD